MGEVEPQPLRGHQRALLGDVVAEHLAQRFVQQMGGGMVGADGAAPAAVDFERKREPGFERAFLDHAGVDEQVARLLLGVGDAEAHPVGRHEAGVADLTAGFSVERRLVEHDGAGLALGQSGDLLAVTHQRGDDALRALGLVAQELGGADLLAQREPHGFGRGLAGARPRRPRHFALALHRPR